VVLFLSLIFCKQEEKILFFGSVSGCTCLILCREKKWGEGYNKSISKSKPHIIYLIVCISINIV
jgi:hypothetical protein